jgi:outer membrane receptor protein involved in Fe transport
MWWRRRPAGRFGAPPAPAGFRLGPVIAGITVALAIIMPLMGASLIAVLALDWAMRRMRATAWIAGTIFAGAILAAGRAGAQTAPTDQPSTQTTLTDQPSTTLPEIVVTPTRSPLPLSAVPESVSVVTPAQVLNTPAQGLDDILQNVPGMTLTQMGPYAAHPTAYNEAMRGLPTTNTRILVLVDGIPVNDPFFGYIQWNRLPLNNIDHVEVVRGGGAPLWGNPAEGGVVNIITKPPDQQGATLNCAGGNYGTYSTGGYGAYFPVDWLKLSLNTAFSGTAGYQTTPDAWYTFGTTTLRSPVYTPTSFNGQSFNLRGDVVPTEGLSGNAVFNYYKDNQILSTPIGANAQNTWTFFGDLKKDFGDGIALTGNLFHDGSIFSTNNPHLLTFTTEYNSNVHTTPVSDTGGSVILSRNSSDLVPLASLGLDFHYISGTDQTNYYAPDGSLMIPTVIGSGDQLFVGGFALARIVPVPQLTFQGSVREQYFENLNGIDTFPPAIGVVPNSSEWSFDPRVDLRYSFTDEFAVRGSYYQSFKAPTLDQLYRSYADTTAGIFEGNPFLKPETLKGGEIGFDFNLSGLRNQLTFYSTNIHNIVTTENLTSAQSPPGLGVTCGFNSVTFTFLTCTRNINAAAGIARGIEDELTWDIGYGFSAVLGFTYADSHYTANQVDPTSVGQRFEGVPWYNASGTLTYVDPSGWRALIQLHGVSMSYGSDHASDNEVQNGYFVINASAAYPLFDKVQLFAQIQNLLDRRYIANNTGGPPILGTPFSALVGLRVTF